MVGQATIYFVYVKHKDLRPCSLVVKHIVIGLNALHLEMFYFSFKQFLNTSSRILTFISDQSSREK